MLTKDELIKMLADNDKAVARALVVLNARQTSNEQVIKNTRDRNGRGFKPCHAFMGTSMAQFYEKHGFLSKKQIAYWRKSDKCGTMRIACYWKQILEVAADVAAAKNGVAQKVVEQ